MDCRVVVEAAVPVYDVETPDEAIRIAIAKTGEMLNPDLNYVEIDMGSRESPGGEELPPAFIAADEALVALELEMTVFNVDGEEHATRIARKEIGRRLDNVPLKVLTVEEVETEDDEDDEDDEPDRAESEPDADGTEPSDSTVVEESVDEADEPDASGTRSSEDDELLPEFEDLVEES